MLQPKKGSGKFFRDRTIRLFLFNGKINGFNPMLVLSLFIRKVINNFDEPIESKLFINKAREKINKTGRFLFADKKT